MNDSYGVIGKPTRRVDARGKVLGQTSFADDLSMPGMLHCKLLRSPKPHARILSIDTTRAREAEGVQLVLTGREMPISFGVLPVSQDEHALCPEVARFVGDPVAAVVARTEEQAADALQLIEVGYGELPVIRTPLEALRPTEHPIHDYGVRGNIHKLVSLRFGDTAAAFEEADHLFEDLFFYEGNTHLPLEQHATLAALEPDGKLIVHSSTQTPHYLHKALARVLEISPGRIRVVATPNGGGFGGKTDPFNHEIVVAKAALLTGRPVKICLTRLEVFYCHRGRHPVLLSLKTGVKSDGTLTGMELKTLLDGGAYGSYGVASTFYTGALQTVTYTLPRYFFRGARTFTNKPPCGPKRGHGTPQPRFGQEVQLDKIACKLAIDPADLRLQQLVEAGDLTANWLEVPSIGLRQCIEKVVDGSGWRDRRGKLPEGRGLGLACSSYLSGAGLPIYWNRMPHSGVQLLLDRGGGVTAFCGATEVGQGSDHVLAACVAEVLGLQPDDIRLVTGDTGLAPVDLGSYSSRVTLMMGNAAIEAATKARDLLAEAVAAKLESSVAGILFSGGRVLDRDKPETSMPFAAAVVAAESKFGTIGTVGSYTPPRAPGRYKGAGVGPSPTYSYSAAIVEVEADSLTGEFRVVKVWIAHDIGQCINPTLVRGQVEGGVYMGLGEALMEEQTFRAPPRRLSNALLHKAPSFLEYKSLTPLEMPDVEVYLVEEPDSRGPFGAKEVGQGPLLPIMPAVANALFDAIGVRIDALPITPDKICKALDRKARGAEPRFGPDRFPEIDWPDPLEIPPPWEGGDGRALGQAPSRPKTTGGNRS